MPDYFNTALISSGTGGALLMLFVILRVALVPCTLASQKANLKRKLHYLFAIGVVLFYFGLFYYLSFVISLFAMQNNFLALVQIFIWALFVGFVNGVFSRVDFCDACGDKILPNKKYPNACYCTNCGAKLKIGGF